MNRRAFLAGLTLAASGLLLPERRFWFLDQTMVEPTEDDLLRIREAEFAEMFPNAVASMARTAAAWEPTAYDEWLENHYLHQLRMEQAGEWVQNTTLEIPSWAERYTRTIQKH
jgi:hypothetical protein